MPIYENRVNAENRVQLSGKAEDRIAIDQSTVYDWLLPRERLTSGYCLAVDGWYGVSWSELAENLSEAARQRGGTPVTVLASEMFIPQERIDEYRRAFLTDDPGFGRVNQDGSIADILDAQAVSRVAEALRAAREKGNCVLLIGNGACIPELRNLIDTVVYAEMTVEPMMWQMWDGALKPFGRTDPRSDYWWKEYYYCDFYLLHRQRKYVQNEMAFFLQAIELDNMKLVERSAFDEMLDLLSRQPIKEVKIFSPGPWGAYRFKDYFEVPGLGCNAWNRLASPDLAMIIEVTPQIRIEMQFLEIMRHQSRIVGERIARNHPDLFPVEIFLDDGFFPQPQPAERTSMPMHNHPDTDYVRRHFNEQIGRYETYYIAEAYEGSSTWMGFEDDADLEEWQKRCFESWKSGEPIENWKEYIANWTTNVGDIFYIPPGITHGHGGNQMVLEMDTCPSISATEYSFFGYDFVRKTWDDEAQAMTGPPMKMHMEHYVDNERGYRREYVDRHLRPRPKVFSFHKHYWLDRYDAPPSMPFLVERLHFKGSGAYDTQGRYMHVVTLTVGKRVTIRSVEEPTRCTQLDFLQSAIIPATFGRYEVESEEPGLCTLVLMRFQDWFT